MIHQSSDPLEQETSPKVEGDTAVTDLESVNSNPELSTGIDQGCIAMPGEWQNGAEAMRAISLGLVLSS